MRHTMNRTVYQPNPMCGCKNGIMSVQKPACRQPNNGGTVPAAPCTEQSSLVQGGVHAEHHGVLAMAYVHVQKPGDVYDPCTALIAGTLFPALDKPFCGETVSASAYPNPPARTCDCALPVRRDGCVGCGMKGGTCRD